MLSLYFSFLIPLYLSPSLTVFLSLSLSLSLLLFFYLLLSRLKNRPYSSVLLPRLNTSNLFPQNRIRLFFYWSSISPIISSRYQRIPTWIFLDDSKSMRDVSRSTRDDCSLINQTTYNYRYYGIINDFILSYMCFFLSRREHDDVVSLSRTMSRPRNKFLFAPGSGEKERESENPETLNQSRVPIIISLWNY